MCTHCCLLYSFPLVLFGNTLLLLSSWRREGVHPELPGVRGLLGGRLPVDVPVAPCFSFGEFYRIFVLRFRCIRLFVIIVINNIRISIYYILFVICAMIYCSFCCIYVWLDPGTYMIARFMFFYKPGVTRQCRARQQLSTTTLPSYSVGTTTTSTFTIPVSTSNPSTVEMLLHLYPFVYPSLRMPSIDPNPL